MAQWKDIESVYVDHPLDNGDALIITDMDFVQQVDGLADHWEPKVRQFVTDILRRIDPLEVVLAVARPDADLLPQDHAMWADLREELLGSGITVHPPKALPAAEPWAA